MNAAIITPVAPASSSSRRSAARRSVGTRRWIAPNPHTSGASTNGASNGCSHVASVAVAAYVAPAAVRPVRAR